MSVIEKLSIRGIRSFSPDREESIEFERPLTVIVGSNGCGKTTIIESLRYACSGNLPPGGAKGQSFVHDPSLSDLTETKACIKMRFQNRAGKEMMVMRSMQLQQLKKTCAFKTLDGVIRTLNEQNKRISIGHKCAELDAVIPDLLGVSKAILDNVIFCHQEDSNWPLLESTTLKKRFDDIFESAKYTKALVSFKKTRKDLLERVKEYSKDLAVLAVHVTESNSLNEALEKNEKRLARAAEEMEKLDTTIRTSEESLAKTVEELKTLSFLIEKISSEKQRIKDKKEALKFMFDNLHDPMGDRSDDELAELLANCDTKAEVHRNDVEKLKRNLTQLHKDKEDVEQELVRLRDQVSSTKTKLETQTMQQKEQSDLMEKFGMTYAIAIASSYSQAGSLSMDNSMTDEDVAKFTTKFQATLAARSSEIEVIKSSHEPKIAAIQSDISQIDKEKYGMEKVLKDKTGQLESLEIEYKTLCAKSCGMVSSNLSQTNSQREISDTDRLLKETEMKLAQHIQRNDTGKIKLDKQNANVKLSNLKFSIKQMGDKIAIMDKYYKCNIENKAKLDTYFHAEEHLKDRIQEVNSKASLYLPSGTDISYRSLEDNLEFLTDLSSDEGKNLEKMSKDVASISSQLNMNVAKCNDLTQTLQKLKAKNQLLESKYIAPLNDLITEMFDGTKSIKDFKEIVVLMEEKLAKAKETCFHAKYTSQFLAKCKEKGTKRKICPVCDRSMDTDELNHFKDFLNSKCDDSTLATKVSKCNAALQTLETQNSLLKNSADHWADWMRIGEECRVKGNELEELGETRKELDFDMKEKQLLMSNLSTKVTDLKDLLSKLSSWVTEKTELLTNVEQCNRLVESLLEDEKRDLMAFPSSLANSLEEGKEEMVELERQKQNCDEEISRLQDQLNSASEETGKLQSDIHQLKAKLDKSKSQIKDMEAAKQTRDRVKVQMNELKDMISSLKSKVPTLDRRFHTLKTELTTVKERYKDQLDMAHKEMIDCQNDLHTFQRACQAVKTTLGYRYDLDLKKQNTAIATENNKMEKLNQKEKELLPRLEKAEHSCNQQVTYEKTINENLSYREKKRELAELAQGFKTLVNQKDSSLSREELEDAIETATETVDSVKHKRSVLVGRVAQLEEECSGFKKKLKTADLKNVNERHRDRIIDYESTKLVAEDLDTYYKALDMALVEFHQRRICEINMIIKDLWSMTYRGQDIETIEINSGKDSGSKNTLSYNYHVVMRKSGAVLPMRGRCSAGQKVLAALVIRLALAETFCLNCGILALDEPTTNLDYENKIGLAQALSDIIVSRSKQSNFQLICITHDEEFVRMLNQAQTLGASNPSHYYRISREEIGENKFYSRIDRHDWNDAS